MTPPIRCSTPDFFEHPFFHVGIVVTDVDEAIERLTATLGLTFLPPRVFKDDPMADPDPRLSTTTVTFSVEGPPYIELIGVETGVYGPDRMGLHHLALWTPDQGASRQHLEANGVRIAATMGGPDSTPLYYTNPDDLCGITIEIFDTGEPRQALYSWLQGQAPSTGSVQLPAGRAR